MQDLNAPANPLETLAYIIAQQIHDHSIVYIGTGIPMVAGILAKKTHAPNITIVYESGGQDPIQGDMPWSVGCPFTWRKSPTIMEMSYSFAQCYNGYVDIGFLGFAQVDMYGNVNTHIIGKDFHKPKVRLTGSGGNSGTFKRFGGSVTAQAMNLPSCARRTTMNGWRNFFCPAADSLKIFRTPSSNGVPEIPV